MMEVKGRAEEAAMRRVGVLIAFLVVVAGTGAVPVRAAPAPGPLLALTGVAHALDGAALVVTGWVENRSPKPVGGLVIDATGLTASGDPSFFGSDGIPWMIAPGGTSGFSIRLPLREQLVRDYAVQVASVAAPLRPLATARRTVHPSLYRSLLHTAVRLSGEIRFDRLTVRSDTRGWPIDGVTAEVVVSIPAFLHRGIVGMGTIETLTVDVPGDASTTIGLGVVDATLVSVRATGIRLRATWGD
jgi:hypothetical protein